MPTLSLDLTVDVAEPEIDDADLTVCLQDGQSVLSYPFCC